MFSHISYGCIDSELVDISFYFLHLSNGHSFIVSTHTHTHCTETNSKDSKISYDDDDDDSHSFSQFH